uniref:procollagen-lysine 5-dioxygenase n=1 Tax=Ditylenchus dipsaci TaxID=166011 RepID=A0A915DG63_9BILA
MDFDENGNARVFNKLYNTHPVVLHGNGPSKLQLSHFGNYIAHGFNLEDGCLRCVAESSKFDESVATIGIAIFIAKPTPYVEEFLQTIQQLEYSKDHVHVFIYNNQAYNKEMIKKFPKQKDGKDVANEHFARDSALNWAVETNVDFTIILDADVHLTNPISLNHLVNIMKTLEIGILAPMVVQSGKLFSNFWGAVSDTGYYARSPDYIELVEKKRTGLWNVPFLNSAVAISRQKLKELLQYQQKPFSYNMASDSDMSFAQFCRDKGHFMMVDNQVDYGFLVSSDSFANLPQESLIHLELYDYPNNKQLWEKRYIHPEYFNTIKPDVVENYGQWSDGGNHDRRLEGGYENVPTRDIHMNQVNFAQQWLAVIDDYVAPMQEKVFTGYYQRPAKSNMMFVVRYRPDEQASLRPHHDASTYSIDIALNKRDVDYEGGGVRYIRYNCTVPADQVGWSMLFPGRLTHLHEGLPTTKGTRYILVSFINP